MAAGLSYIRAVRLRHMTTPGPGFCYTGGSSGFLTPRSVISFPSGSAKLLFSNDMTDYVTFYRRVRIIESLRSKIFS